MPAAQFLYLHGFASGPDSRKGIAFADHFARAGIAIERLNLRVPSFEHLRVSAMIDLVRSRIGERAVIAGSSLGGLTAARVAERDPRVAALVLLAPAFQLVARWRTLPGWDDWQRTGWREVLDHTTGATARVDFGFAEDAARVDQGYPEITVPTLILHGTGDDIVPVAHSRTFAAGRPNVRLVELADGHELTASIPRLLAETEAFLAPWL